MSRLKEAGDIALERLLELLVVTLRIGAHAEALAFPGVEGVLLEADHTPAPAKLFATLLATQAAGAVRELDLDDVQHTCKVSCEAFGLAGFMDIKQQLRRHVREVVELEADQAEVAATTEVVVRDAQGLKARRRSEHRERTLDGAGERPLRAKFVIVTGRAKCDVAEVFPHIPDLLEEQLEGP